MIESLKHHRDKRGNMLVLVTAFIFIIVAIVLFALGYVRLLGSSSEQKTAIEAAALAAAREVSNIVIDTPEFGFVGVSDSAPTGTLTQAGDTFFTPVHSINTLIGTARLDLIIADQLGVSELEELALSDLTAAKVRAQELVDAIEVSLAPSGTAQDKDGSTITPYVAAEQAYQQNQIRMTGSSNYVAGSLQLSLGALANGGHTNVPIPQPVGADATLGASNTVAGNYKSYTNVPFNGTDFVFAGIGDAVKIVDQKQFVTTLALPYFYRTIIRAEAQQQVNDSGLNKSGTLKAVACAQPASVYDPKPYPGALTISFPDGMPTGPQSLANPMSLYGSPLDSGSAQSDFYTADVGDYPTDTGSQISTSGGWPIASDTNHLASNACKIAFYDWLKRAGTKANVNSVLGMHSTPFDPQGADVPWGPAAANLGVIPRGIVHIYRFDSDGLISYQSQDQKPAPYYVVAHSQAFLESFDAITNGDPAIVKGPISLPSAFFSWPSTTTNAQLTLTPAYDLYVRIYSHRPGRINGGKHAGEPMDNSVVAFSPPVSTVKISAVRPGLTIGEVFFPGEGAQGKKWWKKGDPGFVGAPPGLSSRDDFASLPGGTIDTNPIHYEKYDYTGGGVRRTYQENGSVADIRFRRVLRMVNLDSATEAEFAYVGEK